jgi:UDP-N-acetylglucosamine:LPS N-acetylglucosamine transferase
VRSDARRVVVLTADVGEGHVAAARVLAADLHAVSPGTDVVIVDALDVLGPVLRFLLRDAYRIQLYRIPWIFGFLFAAFLRIRLLRALGRFFLAALGARRLQRTLRELEADVIVSTYPAVTSVLGTLRRRGRLRTPTCATITDLGGVQFWSHPGIDSHFVMHPAMVPLVEREAGIGAASPVAPLVAPAFAAAPERDAARLALGLPQTGRVVVVSGGGWGVGKLAKAATIAAQLPETTVVCLAGRNTRLQHTLTSQFAQLEHVRVLGFTDQMQLLLAAADVLVHTTGGVTCLEALTVGCPIVTFGPPAGHAPTLARAMAKLDLAPYARNHKQLGSALTSAVPATKPPAFARSAAHEVLALKRRTPPPVSHHRAAIAVALAAAAVASFLAAGSRTVFAAIAQPLALGPSTVLSTRSAIVGLVVETTPSQVQTTEGMLAGRGHASFAFSRQPAAAVQRSLASQHDQWIHLLGGSGVDDWLGAAETIGSGPGHNVVLAPPGGLSTGQYVLAHLEGLHIVAAATKLEQGAIVVCTPTSIGRVLKLLAARGLRPEPAALLAADGDDA